MARVMIADDAAVARRITKNMLLEGGHEVIFEARDGVEAVNAYRKFRPDLLLMDVTMPNMDGVAAAKRILEDFPKARIVIVTSLGGETIVQKSLDAGVSGYLLKPFRVEGVLKTVERALNA